MSSSTVKCWFRCQYWFPGLWFLDLQPFPSPSWRNGKRFQVSTWSDSSRRVEWEKIPKYKYVRSSAWVKQISSFFWKKLKEQNTFNFGKELTLVKPQKKRVTDFVNCTGHTLLERYGMTEIGMALTNPLYGPRLPVRHALWNVQLFVPIVEFNLHQSSSSFICVFHCTVRFDFSFPFM